MLTWEDVWAFQQVEADRRDAELMGMEPAESGSESESEMGDTLVEREGITPARSGRRCRAKAREESTPAGAEVRTPERSEKKGPLRWWGGSAKKKRRR